MTIQFLGRKTGVKGMTFDFPQIYTQTFVGAGLLAKAACHSH
jgi:hypothetical protein